jgi:alpha-L-fucosidase
MYTRPLLLATLLFSAIVNANGDESKLARPTPDQAAWHDCEIGMFIHFGPNTWRDLEGDDLQMPLEKMNPEQLDTDQWVTTAEAMGAKYIVFVAKHVGGFCMWRTETTDYSIASTSWRGGKGDVLKDLADPSPLRQEPGRD